MYFYIFVLSTEWTFGGQFICLFIDCIIPTINMKVTHDLCKLLCCSNCFVCSAIIIIYQLFFHVLISQSVLDLTFRIARVGGVGEGRIVVV